MGKNKGGRGGELGGLAAALVKAGVADKKSAHGARDTRSRERRELGDDEVARRNSERTSELATAKANRDQVSKDRQRDLAKIGDLEQARQEIRAHHERSRGSKRWFFVARDGRVPFLEVTDSVMRQLGDGAVGIVESLGAVSDEHLVLASSDALERLSEFDPDAIRFWNRGGT